MSQAKKVERPLSPHIFIYRPQISSVLSITHRITGVALSVLMMLVVIFVVALACGENAFDCFMRFADITIIKILAVPALWALFYHSFNGIRHLFWDAGHGFSIPTMTKSGYAVLTAATVMTILVSYLAMIRVGV